MGTICVPTYANIFMSELEERYIYPLIENKSSSYMRLIDHIFMVWTNSENRELESLINEMNKNIILSNLILNVPKRKWNF